MARLVFPSSRIQKRLFAILAGLAWLSTPWLFWQAHQVTPRQITLRDFTGTSRVRGFSNNGRLLACSDEANNMFRITIWDVLVGEKLGELRSQMDVAFAPDGSSVATSEEDDAIKIWDLATFQEVFALRGHTNSVIALEYSPDGLTLASTGHDHTVRLWNTRTGTERMTLPGFHDNYVVKFSPDGQRLATLQGFARLRLWNGATGQLEASFDLASEPSDNQIAFLPDGRPLVLVSEQQGRGTALVDPATGLTWAQSPVDANSAMSSWCQGRLWAVPFIRTSSALERLGDWVGEERVLKWLGPQTRTIVLDIASGRELASLPGWHLPALLPAGKTLVTYSLEDDAIKLWDLPLRRPILQWLAWTDLAAALALTGLWWYLRRKGRAERAFSFPHA